MIFGGCGLSNIILRIIQISEIGRFVVPSSIRSETFLERRALAKSLEPEHLACENLDIKLMSQIVGVYDWVD